MELEKGSVNKHRTGPGFEADWLADEVALTSSFEAIFAIEISSNIDTASTKDPRPIELDSDELESCSEISESERRSGRGEVRSRMVDAGLSMFAVSE